MENYCKRLSNGINFNFKGITFCSSLWSNVASAYTPYDKHYIENFLERRHKTIENAQKGIFPDYCNKCNSKMHTHDNIDESCVEKIKFIEIYHWNQCNCACFYCSNREETNLKITEKRNQKGAIDVMPMLKKLKKLNLLDEHTEISMVGGEPTILKEFPEILKFAIKNKFSVNILSNGILYEKYISKAINETQNTTLIVSLDCGTKEMFKRIKGIDKYDDVIKNLKKYVKETKEKSRNVICKYIILPGVNDNQEEINKWIDQCTSIGITNFFITLEFCKSANDPKKENIPEEICQLYEYTKTKIKEVNPNFSVSTYSFVDEFVKNRSYKVGH
jgi:molybdenum cofactor biosynthesis enzyme MoaA